MSTYSRPHLTFEMQLAQLKARGLLVTDDATALSYLKRVGYYRLSAYWYPFREPDAVNDRKRVVSRNDTFVEGTTFQQAVQLYVFDKKLRMLVMDAIERIEVAVRVDIAYTLGARNTFAHTAPEELHGNFTKKRQPDRATRQPGRTKHQDWLTKLDALTKRSKEEFVAHYIRKHGLPLPMWVVIELWDFGMLSHFFSGLKFADKSAISKRLGVPDADVLGSWLRSINFARNVSAHHSRYFNRTVVDQPKLPVEGEITMFDPHLSGLPSGQPIAWGLKFTCSER